MRIGSCSLCSASAASLSARASVRRGRAIETRFGSELPRCGRLRQGRGHPRGRDHALRKPGRVDDLHGSVPLERVGQHRATEQPSLSELHAERLQRLLLTLGFDALGDDARADVSTERQQRHDQRAARPVRVDRR